jgi:hypothetical protein
VKVRIDPRWDMDAVDVYIYDLIPGHNRIMRFLLDEDQPSYRWDEMTNGQLTQPSLTLPRGVLEQLVVQANDYLPPSAATDRALQDAKEMRDRLLSMVERTFDVWTSPAKLTAPSERAA